MQYNLNELACIALSRETDPVKQKSMLVCLKKDDYVGIIALCDEDSLKSFIRNLDEQDIRAVTRASENYPKRLFNLKMPPVVLYCRGDLSLFEKSAVAIIGTRDCTRYGAQVASKFAKALAERDIVVVSGLADGIDAAAHEGAFLGRKVKNVVGPMDVSSHLPKGTVSVAKPQSGIVNTIAVLGNGLNYIYPQSNADLQRRISKDALLVSEYLPNEKSNRFHFPYRNRIVAALASAVIIVEADLRSGTMITKDWAIDLGVDVYAVPGPITSGASRGTNALIKEAHCAIMTDIEDVLEASFGIFEKTKDEPNVVVQISFDQKRVLDILAKGEAHFDDIIELLGLPVGKVTTLLTTMEMSGLIKKLAGNQYAAS